MRVLVVNAGSSSLKLRLLGSGDEVLADRTIDHWKEGNTGSVVELLQGLDRVHAVGHRIVHGGASFREAIRIDDQILDQITELTPLAPLHQPRAIAGIKAVRDALPGIPSVACFDTAFHAQMPARSAEYALPGVWRKQWKLRRYGFHGLSHAHAARRAAAMLALSEARLRIVTCHLGAGASLAAVKNGHSIDTTMGFTPLEGLVMATRSGTVDPGLVLWLITEANLDPQEVRSGLEEHSGLAGLTGRSGDMRDVLDARAHGDSLAIFAFDIYIHRLVREIGAMSAALNGLDVLVFTGGVGEHASPVRAEAAARLTYLGVAIDEQQNATASTDADISADHATVSTLVIESREDLEIANQTRRVLSTNV